MKRTMTVVLALMVACTMALVACGGKGSAKADTPTATFEKYADYIKKGDFAKAVDILEGSNEATKEQKEFIVALMQEASKENGGVTSYEVLNEEISEDGMTAKIKVKYTWGNGKTKETTEKLVKTENGWACKL